MMYKSKKSFVYIIIIICWIILGLLFKWTILEMINITFFSGLIGMLIGVIIFIVSSGFTALFTSGFRKVSIGLMAKSNSMKDVDKKVKNDPFIQDLKVKIKKNILKVALSFSIVSIFLSVLGLIFYYF